MQTISYSQNWNGRIFLDNFSDVRLRDDEKFYIGNTLNIMLKGSSVGEVEIVAMRFFRFKQITDVLAWTICGKPAPYLAEVLKRLYKSETDINPETELVHLVLHYKYRHIQNQSPFLQDWWREKTDQYNYHVHSNS